MNRLGLALSGGGIRAVLYHLGLIRFLRDAEIQACLILLAVDASRRRGGLATSLVSEGFRRAGGERSVRVDE